MASHLLDEVEKVCTHVAILKNGELVTSGKVNEILSNEDMVEVSSSDNGKLAEILNKLPGISRLSDEKSMIKIFFPVGTTNMTEINNFCFTHGVVLNHLVLRKKSLEARFLELTNNN